MYDRRAIDEVFLDDGRLRGGFAFTIRYCWLTGCLATCAFGPRVPRLEACIASRELRRANPVVSNGKGSYLSEPIASILSRRRGTTWPRLPRTSTKPTKRSLKRNAETASQRFTEPKTWPGCLLLIRSSH